MQIENDPEVPLIEKEDENSVNISSLIIPVYVVEFLRNLTIWIPVVTIQYYHFNVYHRTVLQGGYLGAVQGKFTTYSLPMLCWVNFLFAFWFLCGFQNFLFLIRFLMSVKLYESDYTYTSYRDKIFT